MKSQHPSLRRARCAARSSAAAIVRLAIPCLAAIAPLGCGHDWDAFDPRLGTGGSGATSTAGAGGATGGTVHTGGSTSTGGAISGGSGGGTTSSSSGGTGGATTSSTTTSSTTTSGTTTSGTTTSGTTTSATGPCDPGNEISCYSGPANTAGVGACKAGTQTCGPNGDYGACTGEVLPKLEECGDAIDNDCDSATDNHCAQWAKRYGDAGIQNANGIAVDGANLYIVGGAEETTNFGGNDLDAGGSSSAFVVKLLKADGAHVWSKLYGDAAEQEATGVAVDTNHNVYVIGHFQGSITFGATTLTSGGGQDVFIARLTSDGAPQWAKQISGVGAQNARSVMVTGDGSVVVAGSFSGNTDFLGTNLTASSALDGFLLRLSSAGNLVWVKQFGKGGDDECTAVAPRGEEIVVAGYFSESVSFGGANLNGGDGTDAFLGVYSIAGVSSYGATYVGAGDQMPRAVRSDANGNLYLAGDFSGSVSFGNNVLTSQGGSDVFLAKLDANGGGLWSKRFGDAADQDLGALAVDGSGDPAIAVHHRGTVDYGGGAVVQSGAPPAGDIVVVKLAGATGNHAWSRRFGDASDQDPRDAAFDAGAALYLVGGLTGTANFGPGLLQSGGKADALVARLNP